MKYYELGTNNYSGHPLFCASRGERKMYFLYSATMIFAGGFSNVLLVLFICDRFSWYRTNCWTGYSPLAEVIRITSVEILFYSLKN